MSLKDPNVLNPQAKKRVAIVIANPATSSTTGWLVAQLCRARRQPDYGAAKFLGRRNRTLGG